LGLSLKAWIAAIWGLGGVYLLILYSIVKLAPRAWEALDAEPGFIHWAVAIINLIFMLYVEGYRGFQKSFAPRTVARAHFLFRNPNWRDLSLGPFFCMGYYRMNRRPRIGIYALTVMMIFFILLLPLLPQPWRGALDLGVVIGLSYGIATLSFFTYHAFVRNDPRYSPEIPH